MKTKLIVSFLTFTFLGAVVFSQQPTHAQPVGSAAATAPARPFYPVATTACIQDSGGQMQRIFVNADVAVGELDTDKYKVMLSSAPDSNAPFIVDDAVFVNGQRFNGYTETNSPYDHLSEKPDVCYQAVPAVDVTGCLRHDGHVLVQCMDVGGGVFGCSALYLRVVPR